MKNISWDDYKTAYQVALDGSLSKAGKSLNINHSTVLRRINQLEQALNVKLFIRHQRGYKLTDAGFILMDEMPELLAKFASLENKLQHVEGDISGELRITTVSSYSPVLTLKLKLFLQEYPNIRIKLISTDTIIALDSGEAHISLRAGPRPNGVDLIVKELMPLNTQYYASSDYVETYGIPATLADLNEHLWVLPSVEKHRIPFVQYVLGHIDKDRIAFQSNNFPDIYQAIINGVGIGPLAKYQALTDPTLCLVPLDLPKKDESIWFVYHKDLKRSARITCLYDFLTTTR
ncbi:LysR family transcriptional regulator [Colwellia asteriadis]|uniref:LysR family transcriptional regulator n=1 Tax=Colwellia asteriadis TaxID=517723 RepID=A0ABN1L733_9GAMM